MTTPMGARNYQAERDAGDTMAFHGRLLGRHVSFEYSETWVAYALLALRVVMGWILFQGGIVKVLDPTWTAAGFLLNGIPEGNPFIGLWQSFAGTPAIDFLVAWGLTLTGLGIIVGALLRWNAFWAAVMMLSFWMAGLQGGLSAGLPIDYGWVVDAHIIYVVLLFGLGAFGAGRILGIDAILERTAALKQNGWLRYLLG